jgi:hypothetical protein
MAPIATPTTPGRRVTASTSPTRRQLSRRRPAVPDRARTDCRDRARRPSNGWNRSVPPPRPARTEGAQRYVFNLWVQ